MEVNQPKQVDSFILHFICPSQRLTADNRTGSLLQLDDADLVLDYGYNFSPAAVGLVEVSSNDAPKIAVFEAAVPDLIMGKGHLNEAKVLLVGEAKVGKMEGFCELGLIYTKSSLRSGIFS